MKAYGGVNVDADESRDSVVRIANGYGLATGVGFRVPVGSKIFSLPSRPDRPWGPMGTGGSLPGGKAARA
jgi:hypothetical protein